MLGADFGYNGCGQIDTRRMWRQEMAGVWAGSLVIKANIRRNDMGKFFSDVVEQALKDIYYDVTTGRGQESFRRLEHGRDTDFRRMTTELLLFTTSRWSREVPSACWWP